MCAPSLRKSRVATSLLLLYLTVPRAEADVIRIGVNAFGPGSTLTTFTNLAIGTEVNGLTVDGILYRYSLGNGRVQIAGVGGGPSGNNVEGPKIASGFGFNGGSLTLTFPSFISAFGYGFVVGSTSPPTDPTEIQLFSAATNVGSLTYPAAPDPDLAGGFAGIQSTIPFDSAIVTFNFASSPGFSMDNVRTIGVPESSTFVFLGTGIGLLWSWRRIRRHRV